MLRRVGIAVEQGRDGVGRSIVRLVNTGHEAGHASQTGSEEARKSASGASAASERRSNGSEAPEAAEAEKQETSDAPRETPASGNGADLDGTAPAGTPCVWCGMPLDGALAEQLDGEWRHSQPCHEANARPPEPNPKPKRRSRIKRPGVSA
jgi:hypothetical protein